MDSRISGMLMHLQSNTDYNDTVLVSDWEIFKLFRIESDSAKRCLLKWLTVYASDFVDDENTCNAVWDNVYCWPPARSGKNISIPCAEAFQDSHPLYAPHLKGNALRVCLDNGTWSRGFRTNYEECANSMQEYENEIKVEEKLVILVQYMVFVGSILSLISLGFTIAIFCSFRSVWSERIKVHIHLMVSLVIRFIVFLIITEPYVLNRSSSYRDHSYICKTVLCVHLYTTVTSVSWMLVQGMYLNGKLTTNIFASESRKKFRFYYFIGWVLPVILLLIYLIVMVTSGQVEDCWQGYAEMKEIWILFLPTILASMLNGLYFCNILRIAVTKSRCTKPPSEFCRILSISKATLFLFPILGLNNLLLLYNPVGEYETLYVSMHTFFGSTQGIFVAIVYCFNCTEVHHAIRRSYNRFLARKTLRNETRESTCEYVRKWIPASKKDVNENKSCGDLEEEV